jgi:DNA mismatch endonuclease, patch repair protein
VDIVSRKVRSRMMAGIRGKDTKPEIRVRRFLHASGFRFRLHVRDLPGSPDLLLPQYRAAIFVHGCFWHRHHGCRYAYSPKSNHGFWQAKLEGNRERDQRVRAKLRRLGWRVKVIWECEVGDQSKLDRLVRWLCSTPISDRNAGGK